jgi:hypothetical protein
MAGEELFSRKTSPAGLISDFAVIPLHGLQYNEQKSLPARRPSAGAI